MSLSPLFLTLLGLTPFLFLSTQASPYVAEARTDADFLKRHRLLLNRTAEYHAEEKVIFLGASITENWEHNGAAIWKAKYETRGAFNYGLSGDRTEHVLWRIEAGEFDNVTAKLVVIQVGFNNVNHNDAPADIAKGIAAIVKALQGKIPHVKVLLISILPSGHHNQAIHQTNQLVARTEDRKSLFFLDMTPYLESSPTSLKTENYVSDHIHLTKAGYTLWAKVMEPLFAKLIL